MANIEQADDISIPRDFDSPRPRIRLGVWSMWLLLLAILVPVAVQLVRVRQGPVSTGAAPDFTLTTFSGEQVTLSELNGRVVVINFWASWCGPCEEEAEDLELTWRAYRDQGVMFIGVDYLDSERAALAYLQEFDITYPNGPDLRTEIAQAYRIRGVPETFIVDKSGNMVEVIIGPTTQAQLTTIINRLLSE